MGKVILIGGSPRIGKSTIALTVSSMMNCSCMSTDDIGEVLQAVIPISPMKNKEYRDYYQTTSVDELISDIEEYHTKMKPSIEHLINVHSTWGSSIVMEGWALYPHYIHKLICDNVSAVWLIADNNILEQRLKERTGFLDGIAADNYLLRSKWHNELLLNECKKYSLPYIAINKNEDRIGLANKILSITNN